MSSDISPQIRRVIWERADFRCEYCRLPEFLAVHKHEPDHIVARQHGGDNSLDNLACACMRCNRRKGPNVGSFDPETGYLVPLFNPRNQSWLEHFSTEGAVMHPLTSEGRVTVRLLELNSPDRLLERGVMLNAGISF